MNLIFRARFKQRKVAHPISSSSDIITQVKTTPKRPRSLNNDSFGARVNPYHTDGCELRVGMSYTPVCMDDSYTRRLYNWLNRYLIWYDRQLGTKIRRPSRIDNAILGADATSDGSICYLGLGNRAQIPMSPAYVRRLHNWLGRYLAWREEQDKA